MISAEGPFPDLLLTSSSLALRGKVSMRAPTDDDGVD